VSDIGTVDPRLDTPDKGDEKPQAPPRYELRTVGVYDRESGREVRPTDDGWSEYLAWSKAGHVADPHPEPIQPVDPQDERGAAELLVADVQAFRSMRRMLAERRGEAQDERAELTALEARFALSAGKGADLTAAILDPNVDAREAEAVKDVVRKGKG
jgi:hypothetical protein